MSVFIVLQNNKYSVKKIQNNGIKSFVSLCQKKSEMRRMAREINCHHHKLCYIFDLAIYFDNTGSSTGLKMALSC